MPSIGHDNAGTGVTTAGAPCTFVVAEPVVAPLTVSVAVIDCIPPVLSVAENVPVPFESVEFAGSIAAPSELVKWTAPP